MTKLPFYQIDAFATRTFEGNQACVMPLDDYLSDETLQAIAAENNVAETAFIVERNTGRWDLRWFTPAAEVPLCGHATLASAHVLFAHEGFAGEKIEFATRKAGILTVERKGSGYQMDFPRPPVEETEIDNDVAEAMGIRPVRCFKGSFNALQYETVDDVHALSPDVKALTTMGVLEAPWDTGNFGCFTLTPEGEFDVVSRLFAPGVGIDEDPATGSWHCMLAGVVQQLTGQDKANCYQAYPGRGAVIGTECSGKRILMSGQAVTVIEGKFSL